MVRRLLLARLASLPFMAWSASRAQNPPKKLKIMMKSAWGLRRSNEGCLSVRARTCAC